MSEKINFGQIEAAASLELVTPGVHKFVVSNSEFVIPTDKKQDGSSKTMYVKLTFEDVKNGGSFSETFYITPKTLPRFQYLHESWFGKKLTKEFNSLEDVGKYFEKVFNSPDAKKFTNYMKIQGEEDSKGKIWPKIEYVGFIIPADKNPEDVTFEPGTAEFILNVKKSNAVVASTNSTFIPSSDGSVSDPSDDLPF